MRGEYPIFPLLFMFTIVVSFVLTFAFIFTTAGKIGVEHAGIRSAAVFQLYDQVDRANGFLETSIRMATRDAVAQQERTQRYPCSTIGRFSDTSRCDSTLFDEEEFTRPIDAIVSESVNVWVGLYPRALLPDVTISKEAVDGKIRYTARSSDDAVFFLDDVFWYPGGGSRKQAQRQSDPFDPLDAPTHTESIGAMAEVTELIEPAFERRRSFDPGALDMLISTALEADQTYCVNDEGTDPWAPITAVERIVDIINSCAVSVSVCSCGDLLLPDVDPYSLAFSENAIVLSNEVYEKRYPVRSALNETESPIPLTGERYGLLMRDGKVSIVPRIETEGLGPCVSMLPKINVFSTVPIVIDTELNCRDPTNEGATCQERGGSTVTTSDIFGLDADRVAIYDRSADYASWLPIYTSSPTESQGISREEAEDARLQAMDEISGRFFDNAVRENGMNIFLVTHDDAEETRGSAMRYATSEESGLPVTIDSMLTGLYPAPEARIESIIEEIDISDLEETCRDRLGDIQILRDPYRVRDVLVPQTEFFAPFVEAEYPYVIISIPRSYIDECADEGSLDFASDERGKRIQEIVLKAAVRASIIHSSAMPSGRLLCLDDPVELVTHHPFLGYELYSIYPYVIVPEPPSGFVWPLEDVGTFTQCWGPPTDPWAFDRDGKEIPAPYTYHRGIDLQPEPFGFDVRKHYGTVFEHFPDGEVVAITDGKVVYADVCGLSVFPEHYPMRLSPFFIEDEGDGGVAAALAPRGDGPSLAEEYCGETLGSGFGEHLVIEHEEYYAIYGHLAPGSVYAYFAQRDDRFTEGLDEAGIESILYKDDPVFVSQGDVLGLVGNTGTSTGAHLHFEIYRKDQGGIAGNTKRPITSQKGYTYPATDFIQFNPFCVLPREVVLDDGSSYDIIDRLPRSSGIDRNPPPTSGFEGDEASVVSTDESTAESSEGFVRPANDVVMCLNNYWQAYLQYNPLSETYGVCP